MNTYAFLPVIFLKFWYVDAPTEMLRFFVSVNKAFFHVFSLPILLRTFFKPIKNEYRQGLVGFSRVMGMFVKSLIILVDMLILIPLLFIECAAFILFLLFPVITVLLLFI